MQASSPPTDFFKAGNLHSDNSKERLSVNKGSGIKNHGLISSTAVRNRHGSIVFGPVKTRPLSFAAAESSSQKLALNLVPCGVCSSVGWQKGAGGGSGTTSQRVYTGYYYNMAFAPCSALRQQKSHNTPQKIKRQEKKLSRRKKNAKKSVTSTPEK